MKIYMRMTGIAISILFVLSISVSAQEKADSMKKVMEEASIVKVGDSAPDFYVEMSDGSTMQLSEMKGKIILLNFWATWCGPCMKEFKEIPDKILRRFESNRDFVFIPVSRGETRETVRKKLNQLKEDGIDFPVGFDPEKVVYGLYAESYIPRNYLIDREGNVVYTSIGYEETEFSELVDTIERLLQ